MLESMKYCITYDILSTFQLCAMKNNDTFFWGKAEETEISLDMDNSKPPVLTFHHNNITIIIALACCSLCETRLYVEAIKSESEFVSFK